ncbi:MAG: HD domain-containing phosphohydrolase [Pseudomonadota bacterium]
MVEAARLQRMIVAFSVGALALVAAIVAAVAILPMQRQMKSSADAALVHGLALDSVAVGEIVARAQDLARQVTSRSVIRDALIRYNRGEMTAEQLAAFTSDKLADAMRLSDEILGILRLDAEGNPVVAVGRPIPASLWDPAFSPPPPITPPRAVEGGHALVVSAPILGKDNRHEGTDVLLFDAAALKALVTNHEGRGETGEVILAGPEGPFFPLRRPPGILSRALERAGDSPDLVSGRGGDGEAEAAAVRRLPQAGWIAVSRMAERELYFQVDRLILAVGGVVAALIAVGTGGLWLMLRPMAGRMLIHTSDLAQEVEEHRMAEASLRVVNRAMRTLSAGNQALVHAESEEHLLRTMCEVMVEAGGYAAASVALDAGGHPVARAGDPGIAALTAGVGLAATVMSAGTAVAVPDIDLDPVVGHWRDTYRALGVRSLLVLPLVAGGGPALGVLAIHAAQPHVFADPEERALLDELAGDLAYGLQTLRARTDRDRHRAALERVLEGTIQAVATTVEVRDPYTAGHQHRVADIAVAIGRAMGLDEERQKGLRVAGLVHDIGKVSIPAEILNRPSKLSETEFAVIKGHPRTGWDILSPIDFPWPVADVVLHHHERLDGSGYPDGLKGDEIGLEARIMAVADVVEAIASHRPYRPALGLEAAVAELRAHRGTRYDPDVVDACARLVETGALKLS